MDVLSGRELESGEVEPREEERGELERMSLLEHLEQLRNALVKSAIAVIVGFLVCWSFAKPIFSFLTKPIVELLPDGKLIFLDVTEPFMLYMKVALLAGTFLTSPFVLYQVWRYLAPAFYRDELPWAAGFVISGSLLFLAGGAFAYWVVFPQAVAFLVGVGSELTPAVTGGSYLSFLMTIVFGLALMFQLPLLLVVLARMGVVTPRFLLRHFRWAVVIIFIVAAIITPTPDVFNLCLFAVPTLGLYLVGIAGAALVAPRKARKRETQA